MSKILGELDASVQAKIEADTEFQESLKDLPDDQKKQKFDEKKAELLDAELAAIREKAEKAEKNEELANNYKIRAEKAEKGSKKDSTKDSQDGLPTKDILYIAKANIHEDDLEEVLEIARLKKIDVSKAHEYLKPVLEVRSEERRTAAATVTNRGSRGSSTVTGEDLLRKAESTGEVPADAEGMAKIAEARLARRKAKLAK